MLRVQSSEISLAYEALGQGTAVLFLHGAAMQLTDWPEALVERLAGDFSALTVDLRDSGLSSKLGPCREVMAGHSWSALRQQADAAPYDLFDMADDVVGAMNGLALPKAHLVGVSMGGMIAQLVAARHPKRVLSLTSLMSSAGQAGLNPAPEVRRALTDAFKVFAGPREAAQRLSLSQAAYHGPDDRYDAMAARRTLERALSRSYCPNGVFRQLQAIFATGNRQALLGQIRCPTLVIHGTADRCIDSSAALSARQVIPDCEFRTIEGMGHEFTDANALILADAVHRHCCEAEGRQSALLTEIASGTRSQKTASSGSFQGQ
ncbi:MAG: alpha/beta hydrolase [Rhodospirillales bacterium]